MNKEEIKKSAIKIMNDVVTGDQTGQSGIEDLENMLQDAKEIKEFIEYISLATKNYLK